MDRTCCRLGALPAPFADYQVKSHYDKDRDACNAPTRGKMFFSMLAIDPPVAVVGRKLVSPSLALPLRERGLSDVTNQVSMD
jgi:hypothetical protein